MRTWEYELENADICDLLWNLNAGKNHKAGNLFLASCFFAGILSIIPGGLSLCFTPEGPQSSLWLLFRILSLIGGVAWTLLLILVFTALIQYVGMRKLTKSKRHTIILTEHWLDCKSTDGLFEQYPYGAVKKIEITRRLMIIYLDKKCSVKVVIPVPLRALPEGSADPYLSLIEEKMRADGGFSLQDEETMALRPEGCQYHFAFIHTKDEWVETFLSAQNYVGSINAYVIFVGAVFCISLLFSVISIILKEGSWLKAWIFLCVYMLFIFCIIVRTFRSKKKAQTGKNVGMRYNVKRIPGTRIGKKTVDVMEDDVIFCCGAERWNITYGKVKKVIDSPLGIYIFAASGAFIHIPLWAFENEEERLKVLDFFRERGMKVVESRGEK